ncbi:GNAT family N-acetyltransferase [Cohnella sp. WQ 127256]|uniref:GNAT family N-acetyltransferase n=1 Tax=Cohnella sp. WQ 127256 TaxID=2938790 RepID=UPI002118E066|nr:GNAT family N-acetyltransferase [Cohnella sp. WQ 127256]
MNLSCTTIQLIEEIERSEVEYMQDRMIAIRSRADNPEGIEIERIGNVTCYYSRTMPWPSFNTVKGIRSSDMDLIDPILDFYSSKGRKPQLEVVPTLVEQKLLKCLSERGFYQSGFHTSLYMDLTQYEEDDDRDSITVRELQEDEIEVYATIHCRGTGLSNDGIPHVAANNKVLYNRPGWKFYIAYKDKTAAAVGVMYMKDGVASLTFAATLPEFRSQGFQQSLLKRRISEAARSDCRLVVAQCAFLSQSHRNMERVGMRIGYVRASWSVA